MRCSLSSHLRAALLVATPRSDFLQTVPLMTSGGTYDVSQMSNRANTVTACKFKPGVRLVIVDLALPEAEQLIRDIEALAPELPVVAFSAAEVSPSWNQKLRHDFGNLASVIDRAEPLAVEVQKLMASQHH